MSGFWEEPDDIGNYSLDDICGRCGHALRFHGHADGGDFCYFLISPRNGCGCRANSDAFDSSKDEREAGNCAQPCVGPHPRSTPACAREPDHVDEYHKCAKCLEKYP